MTNPIRLLKIATRAARLMELFTRASTDWETRTLKGDDMSKSIFKSKTFWLNALTAAAELSQVLPLPPGALAIAATVINIGLRFLTDDSVHLIAPKR
jgi:hypothetical protein